MKMLGVFCLCFLLCGVQSELRNVKDELEKELQNLNNLFHGHSIDGLLAQLQGQDHTHLDAILQHYAANGNHPNVDNLLQHIQHLTHQRKRNLASNLQHSVEQLQQTLQHLGDPNGGLLDVLTHELQGIHPSLTDLLTGGADHLLHNLNNLAHHDKRSVLESLKASVDQLTGMLHQGSGQANGGSLLETLSQQLGGAKQTLATLLASTSESLQGLNHNVVDTLGQVHNGLVGGAHQVLDTLLHPQSK